jgi:membrane protease subunit HflK
MKQLNDKKSPLIKTVSDFMFLVKAMMVLVFVGFCFSGITLIRPDEIGLVLRMGRLTGNTLADRIHQPGWVFALPQPIDVVLKIPVKQIHEVKIRELAAVKKKDEAEYRNIDPVSEGYCVSGDENIFQVSAIVKFQISDPVKAVFGFTGTYSPLDRLIHDLSVAELVKIACRYPIDGILSEDKKQYSLQVREKVQETLDSLESGLSLVSFELEEIAPPVFLKGDFEEVNTAFINRRNFINDANSLSEEKLPKARAQANEMVKQAEAYYQTVLAEASAEAGKFTELLQAYLANPEEVRMNMIDKTRKTVIAAMKNIIMLPGEKDCGAGIRTYIGTNKNPSALPYDSRQIYQDEEEE